MQQLDPHQRPPDTVRSLYKKVQKTKAQELPCDGHVIDLADTCRNALPKGVRVLREIETASLADAFCAFAGPDAGVDLQHHGPNSNIAVFEHHDMPGLQIIPFLLPPKVQLILLSRLLHRNLSNPAHLTNIHAHYNISYPPASTSFFSVPPSSQDPVATPLDPVVHRPLTIAQLLNKKMRWTTLGGQYDWTAKRYPDSAPPPFPPDIKELLEGIFTDTKAEAAIVNLYSPGDTLSVHRDVAETSSHGLISLSLGCDAMFVIGTNDKAFTLRLKSGSAVYMSGASRFAWHGVPQIVAESCPEYLQDWPGGEKGEYEEWKGWMAGKRVNLNVRQMGNRPCQQSM